MSSRSRSLTTSGDLTYTLMMTARFISLVVTGFQFLHLEPGVKEPALSFSAITSSAYLFVPSTNISIIASSKKRAKNCRGVAVGSKEIRGPGCSLNVGGVGGESAWRSSTRIQLSVAGCFSLRDVAYAPLPTPLLHRPRLIPLALLIPLTGDRLLSLSIVS